MLARRLKDAASSDPELGKGGRPLVLAEHPGGVRDEEGSLIVSAPAGLADVPRPDVIVVPGGPGQASQMQDGAVHEWLRAADQASTAAG